VTSYIERPCLACVVGLFEECHHPQEVEGEPDYIIPCAVWLNEIVEPTRVEKERNPVGRPLSDPEDIKDVTSTGRKRAAAMHPILEGMKCDWAGLKHAGGGVFPIVGCAGHVLKKKGAHEGNVWQGDLHHGPDKNVLHNTPGVNLHAICNQCHKRWHELNDPHYETPRPPAGKTWTPEGTYFGHDPMTLATDEDRAENEAWWALPVNERPEYPFRPPDTARTFSTIPSDLATLSHNPFTGEEFDIL